MSQSSSPGEWRVICPDMRGRGDSAYAKDSATYNPLQYADDLAVLLEQAGIERFVSIGTSLGGLLTMIMAMTDAGSDRRRAAQRCRAGDSIPPGWNGSATMSARAAAFRPGCMPRASLEEAQGAVFPRLPDR